MLNWGILLVLLAGIGLWIYKYALPAITKRKAQLYLQSIIFPEGEVQKREVLTLFHNFTKHRFSDEQILDYFIKIKGLQSLSICNNTDFWARKYLLSATDIRLNYFEQVKFYEIFMNYTRDQPMSSGRGTKHDTKTTNNQTELTNKSEYRTTKKFLLKST